MLLIITAPKPTFEPLITKKEPPVNDTYSEIRRAKDKNEEIQIGRIVMLLKCISCFVRVNQFIFKNVCFSCGQANTTKKRSTRRIETN